MLFLNILHILLAESRSYAYRREDGVYVVPIECLKDCIQTLDLLEISLLDHIIISDGRWYSFADECVTEFGNLTSGNIDLTLPKAYSIRKANS